MKIEDNTLFISIYLLFQFINNKYNILLVYCVVYEQYKHLQRVELGGSHLKKCLLLRMAGVAITQI